MFLKGSGHHPALHQMVKAHESILHVSNLKINQGIKKHNNHIFPLLTNQSARWLPVGRNHKDTPVVSTVHRHSH